MARYRVLEVNDFGKTIASRERFAMDVLVGLSAEPKRLPSKYFYDAEGSRLFQAITRLPEYYPASVEREILLAGRERLTALCRDSSFNLIELGPGSGQKTRLLLSYFFENGLKFRYIPIDICETSIRHLTEALTSDYPQIDVQGLVSGYVDGIDWLEHKSKRRNVVLFLGSDIGNLSDDELLRLLASLWNVLRDGDYLMIGFDLKKDLAILLQAYSDSQGITRAFNLNLLERINRELGGHFDVAEFEHAACYSFQLGAMESFLVSKTAQHVHVKSLQRTFFFDAWEAVHVEVSYKYAPRQIESLAARSGFEVVVHLADERHWFLESIWRCSKKSGCHAECSV